MAKSSLRLKKSELKEFLDEKAALYESPKFIGTDPIQIPHQFSKKRTYLNKLFNITSKLNFFSKLKK